MGRRQSLQEKLVNILGSPNVYFEPPENLKMRYPCIVYERNNVDVDYADDRAYKLRVQYSMTVMDRDPDSEIYMDLLKEFEHITYDRHQDVKGLSHDYLKLYY